MAPERQKALAEGLLDRRHPGGSGGFANDAHLQVCLVFHPGINIRL